MNTTHHIKIDMVRKSVKPRVYAMQYDTNTRVVEIELLANGAAWTPPDGATFAVSYRKPDGTRGFYNMLSDDTSAISVSENKVSVILAFQVLTVPGDVDAALVINNENAHRLTSFPFEVNVTADPSAGTTASDDYFNCGGIAVGGGEFYVTAAVVSGPDADGAYTCTADKTMAEIRAAYDAMRSVVLRFPMAAEDYLQIPMVICTESGIGFSLYAGGDAIGQGGNASWEALIEDDESFYVTRKEGGGKAVLYTEQALTEAQQAQARANIGAAAGSIDLVNPEDTAVIRLSGKETGIDILGLTVQAGKNFYVPQSEDTIDPHYYVSGAPYSTTQFDSTYNCTGPIPVSENTAYTIGFIPVFRHGGTIEITVPWGAAVQGLFFYKEDGTYISQTLDATFTTPAECAYIRFNYYVTYNIEVAENWRQDVPGIDMMNDYLAIVEGSELPSGLDQLKSVTLRDRLNESNYRPALYYYADDDSAVYVASKFNAEQDLAIKLAKRGPNNIFDFAGFKLAPNEKETVVSNFADYDLWETAYATGSDWHAPFQVEAINNADGDTPESGNFTGGNHNFVNTGALDSAPTGRTSDIKIFADGRAVSNNAEGYCTNLVICWTNMIQGGNTAKADGTGREILQENHRAVWNGVQWREDIELIALEDIDLSLWYGLQFQGFTETGLKNLRFYGGTNRALHAAPGAYESGNKTANRVRAYNDSLALEMFFDNTHDMGDGSMNSGNLPALFTSAGKCYCRIVSGSHNIAAGEAYAFSGGYRFMPTAGL